jgi:hypothetical protein
MSKVLDPFRFVLIALAGWMNHLSLANNGSAEKLLGCEAFISMMKTAKLWNGDNPSYVQRLSGKRTLFVQAQMRSRFMVVAEIRRQRSLEMAGVQDDVVVQALPPNRPDEPLGVGILPGALRCGENLLHAQRLDSQSNLNTVPAIPIAEEITGSVSVCERFYDLLGGPIPGRMLGGIEVQHLATIVFQDDKHEQDLHCDGRHGKEIGGYHLADVVVQEGPPGLVRRATESAQEARNSALGNSDTEHLEFAMNSGCSPQRIGGDHLCNQLAEFCGGAGATSSPALRLGKKSPESPEPLALPSHNGVWLDVEQRLVPVAPQTPEGNPKYPVQGRQQRPLSLKGGDLHP